jgi:hypothetical protein
LLSASWTRQASPPAEAFTDWIKARKPKLMLHIDCQLFSGGILMKKLLVTLTLIGMFCVPSIAQDLSQVEVYGGYLFQKYPGVYLHGFVGAVEVNINRFFSVVGEYGFGYNGLSYWEGDVSWNDMTFMIGPRFSFRRDRIRLFAHTLWGGMRNS